jgi:hypothetical protein
MPRRFYLADAAELEPSQRAFVVCETFSLMTKPKQMHLKNPININRRIAAGSRGRH